MANIAQLFEIALAIGLLSVAGFSALVFILGLGLKRRSALILTGSVLFLALVEIMSRLMIRQYSLLQAIGSRWIIQGALLSFALMIAIGFTVSVLVLMFGAWLMRRQKTHPSESLAHPEKRRVFRQLTAWTLGGLTIPLTSRAAFHAYQDPELSLVDIPMKALHPDLIGFHIIQLCDLHLTPARSLNFLESLVTRINALQPDLIALTGDLADGYVREFSEYLSILGRLKARLGVCFVTGNHEYYWDAEAWCQAYQDLGFTVLNNRHVVLRKGEAQIVLAGIADATAEHHVKSHKSSPAAAFRDSPPAALNILLAHQPHSLFESLSLPVDLQLSGHTHGGQILPLGYFIRASQPFLAGLHRSAHRWIHVSRGAGFSGAPLRVGTRPEIASLRLSLSD